MLYCMFSTQLSSVPGDHTISPSTLPSPGPTQSDVALSLYISVGVGGVVVVLIAAAAVIVISVTVCLRKRKNKHVNTITAYGMSENEMEISTNAAYKATSSSNLQYVPDTYDYVGITPPNHSYVTSPCLHQPSI